MSKQQFFVWFCLYGFWAFFTLIFFERFRIRVIGMAGMLVFGSALAYLQGLVSVPKVTPVRLELWQIYPFVFVIFVASLVQQELKERHTVKDIHVLCDSINGFVEEQGKGIGIGRQWQRTLKKYIQGSYGKRANRILRGTPYTTELALKPMQLKDIRMVNTMLRAYLMSLSQDRITRRVKRCLRDVLVGSVFFMLVWAIPIIRHAHFKF